MSRCLASSASRVTATHPPGTAKNIPYMNHNKGEVVRALNMIHTPIPKPARPEILRSQKVAEIPQLEDEDRMYDIKYYSRNTRREGHLGLDVSHSHLVDF